MVAFGVNLLLFYLSYAWSREVQASVGIFPVIIISLITVRYRFSPATSRGDALVNGLYGSHV